jgi:hypothetical protein
MNDAPLQYILPANTLTAVLRCTACPYAHMYSIYPVLTKLTFETYMYTLNIVVVIRVANNKYAQSSI